MDLRVTPVGDKVLLEAEGLLDEVRTDILRAPSARFTLPHEHACRVIALGREAEDALAGSVQPGDLVILAHGTGDSVWLEEGADRFNFRGHGRRLVFSRHSDLIVGKIER